MCYRILRSTFLAILVALTLIACTGSEQGTSGQAAWYSRNSLYSYSAENGNLWDHMRRNMTMPSYTYTTAVQQQIRWFEHHQDYLNHVISESAPYIYYIYQQTQQHHLPAELALIPVIESEYNPYARSKDGATGLWQMMPDTAKGFGLKKDYWYDGRKDVVASTNAALDYFTYLHAFFDNNWPLAIASYDAGEGTVMRVMRYNRMHGYATDFWNLPLPNETREYVPRLLAVAAIVKQPGRYGVHLAPINDAPYLDQVTLHGPINLNSAAKMAGVSLTTMKVLNPGIQHMSTDPHGPYSLLVPYQEAETFKTKLATLTQNERLAWQEHVVKSRETLAKIAAKYQTTVALLRKVNGLTSDRVHPHQTLLIPPQPNTGTLLASNVSNSQKDTSKPTLPAPAPETPAQIVASTENAITKANAATTITTSTTYRVAKGDDLQKISHHFKVSVADIRKTNHLTTIVLQPGQELNIPSTGADNTPLVATNSSHKHKHVIYTVRSGDAISKIAKRYSVTVAEIQKWNDLSSQKDLKPGQKLVIDADA